MRYIKLIVLLTFLPVYLYSQSGESSYNFLRFPTSSRINALGGHSVSLVESDPSLIFHNPALLGGEMDGMINANYMNYIADINIGSAVFAKALFGMAASRASTCPTTRVRVSLSFACQTMPAES